MEELINSRRDEDGRDRHKDIRKLFYPSWNILSLPRLYMHIRFYSISNLRCQTISLLGNVPSDVWGRKKIVKATGAKEHRHKYFSLSFSFLPEGTSFTPLLLSKPASFIFVSDFAGLLVHTIAILIFFFS